MTIIKILSVFVFCLLFDDFVFFEGQHIAKFVKICPTTAQKFIAFFHNWVNSVMRHRSPSFSQSRVIPRYMSTSHLQQQFLWHQQRVPRMLHTWPSTIRTQFCSDRQWCWTMIRRVDHLMPPTVDNWHVNNVTISVHSYLTDKYMTFVLPVESALIIPCSPNLEMGVIHWTNCIGKGMWVIPAPWNWDIVLLSHKNGHKHVSKIITHRRLGVSEVYLNDEKFIWLPENHLTSK